MGFRHWQFVLYFRRKVRLGRIKSIRGFERGHFELTRSKSAEEYCNKLETSLGSKFQFGGLPFKRNSCTDWSAIKALAKSGKIDEVPDDIYVRYYRTLVSIQADHAKPLGMPKQVTLFVGPTGTGKSHLAWRRAGEDGYPKDPNSKFWCGYTNQKNVVIDEFRGNINVSHLLRWLDKYPCIVEVKGGSRPLCCVAIWITSNIMPREWYPELDSRTLDALERRMEIVEMTEPYVE